MPGASLGNRIGPLHIRSSLLPKSIKTLCLYCGASKGNSPIYTDAAIQIGERIAQRGNTLVYGAGNVGLMGVAADAALNNHGEVIGVIPESLMEWEVAHTGITRLEIVSTMHERKMRMFDISDGFIAISFLLSYERLFICSMFILNKIVFLCQAFFSFFVYPDFSVFSKKSCTCHFRPDMAVRTFWKRTDPFRNRL